MKKFLVNTIWAVGGIALALFCLSACTRELDVQQAYDISLEVMPVQNSIAKGEIRPIPSFLEYPRGKSQISTWIFFIFHVGVIHFLRSFI